MTRLTTFLFLLTGIAALSGCKKIKDNYTTFEVPYSAGYAVPADDSIGVERIYTSYDFPTSIDDALLQNKTSKSLIESGKLKSLEMDIVRYDSTITLMYGALEEIRVYLDADGLGETFAAYKTIDPSAGSRVVFDIVDVDLKEYLKRDTFRIRIKMTLRSAIPKDTPMLFKSKFTIRAKTL